MFNYYRYIEIFGTYREKADRNKSSANTQGGRIYDLTLIFVHLEKD